MMQKQLSKLEITGSFVALACAIHCISIPLFIAFGGIGLIEILDHTFLELGFLFATMSIAGWSIFVNYRKGSVNSKPILLFVFGFIALFLSITFHLHLLSAVGGILIATAHYLNWRYLRHAH